MLAKGTVVSDKYAIEESIGSGGMGTVYRAQHLATMRRFALKVIDPALVANDTMMARFRREAKAPALIAHTGVCDVYDLGQLSDGTPYMVMDYLEGETLQARLARLGTLSVHESVSIVSDVLDAIGAAHQAGIVHRDLKPANIFITKQGRVKVLDFGILKFAEYLAETLITKTGTRMGTPMYMSPEQMRNSRDVGQEADIYAVGAMLYHMLAGAPPFYAANFAQIVVKTQTEPNRRLIKLNADVPETLSDAVDRMLEKKPMHRPHSAEAARDLLLEAIGLLQAIPDPPTKPNKMGSRS